MNANELNEQTGKLNINNKAHLQIMLGHYTHLLQERLEVQMTKAQSALWHEKLAALDAKYNLRDFIFIAMDIPKDHVNYQLVGRVLDILDAIRDTDFEVNNSGGFSGSSSPNTSQYGSNLSLIAKRNPIQEAFLKKIEQYKQRMNSPTAGSSMRQAFRAKIEAELKKMQAEKAAEEEITANSVR